jgi:hypothetical protein
MRTCIKLFLIVFLFFISNIGIQAQTTQNKPDQVELIKQFIGTWKCELGKDTFLISENKLFGNGILSYSQIVTKGINLDSIIQLYGYDKKADKYIVAEQIKSSSAIEICSAWFTSNNAGEMIITNPENAPFTFKFEFKTPDLIIQTAIQNGKVVKKVMGIRVK